MQSQVNQLKITQGFNVNYQTTHRSQLDDLDTGLGWDDIGSSFGTGTPTTGIADNSRQHMSDPNKIKPEPIQEETREEESPFEGGGGLKNMNIQSPTPKTGVTYDAPSPSYQGNTTARKSPGNVTPDNWKTTPRDAVTPESMRGGRKSNVGGKKSPENRTPRKKSPGTQSVRQQSPGVNAKSNPVTRNQTPEDEHEGNRTQRQQDSGLNDV